MTELSRRSAIGAAALAAAWLTTARNALSQAPLHAPGQNGRVALDTFINAISTDAGWYAYADFLADTTASPGVTEPQVKAALQAMHIDQLIPEGNVDSVAKHWVDLSKDADDGDRPAESALVTLSIIFHALLGYELNENGVPIGPVPGI